MCRFVSHFEIPGEDAAVLQKRQIGANDPQKYGDSAASGGGGGGQHGTAGLARSSAWESRSDRTGNETAHRLGGAGAAAVLALVSSAGRP